MRELREDPRRRDGREEARPERRRATLTQKAPPVAAPSRWRDLREWMARVDQIGELRVIRGASWQEDIGAITEILEHEEGAPGIAFDDVPGYPSGRRRDVHWHSNPTRRAGR